jgi:hypothetical protein
MNPAAPRLAPFARTDPHRRSRAAREFLPRMHTGASGSKGYSKLNEALPKS